jgi:hypothetical protein
VPVELVVLVPVEVLARAVLPEQAAAARVLLPIQPQILQARPGAAAPILRAWVIRGPVRTPTPMTRAAQLIEIKIARPVAAESQCTRMLPSPPQLGGRIPMARFTRTLWTVHECVQSVQPLVSAKGVEAYFRCLLGRWRRRQKIAELSTQHVYFTPASRAGLAGLMSNSEVAF